MLPESVNSMQDSASRCRLQHRLGDCDCDPDIDCCSDGHAPAGLILTAGISLALVLMVIVPMEIVPMELVVCLIRTSIQPAMSSSER